MSNRSQIQTKKQIEESLQLPLEFIQKLVCKQILCPSNNQTTNLVLTHFKSKFYSNQDLKIIYNVINNYWTKYNSAPTIDLIYKIFNNDKFKQKKQKYTKLINEVYNIDQSKFDKKYIQDTVLNYIKAKSVFTTILDNIDYIQTYNDVSKIMPKLQQTMKISLQDEIGVQYFQNFQIYVKQLTAKTSKIPFLWKQWDNFTYGGIPVNQACLFMIMAQPGLGKSQMMMNIGYNWLQQNKNVLMVSLEMSQMMYASRMSALFSDICVNELKDHVQVLSKKVKLFKATHSESRLYIKQYSPNEFNSNKLKSLLQKLKKSKNFVPDLIIVDYLNIMSTNAPSYNMKSYQRVGTISKQLRSVSIETLIPIISATQTNRSSSSGGYAGQDISMSNTSDSAGINMDADCLFGLYQIQGDRQIGRINVKILKNRLGGFVNQTFPMMVDYLTLKISDWDKIDEDDNSVLDTQTTEKLQQRQNKQQIDNLLNI